MKTVEGWETEPLGRVARITMGQSPDSKYYSEEENGLPFLQGCAEFKSRFPKHSFYCSQTKKIATVGSILFSVRAPVGKINIADRDYIIGRGLAGISGIEVDQAYLEHYLSFVESNFRNASQGSTFEAINSSELNGWPIEHPVSNAEQSKIAEILSTVDQAIEQTEALIAKQQRIKTGLMQDLLTHGIDEHGNLRSEQTHKFKDSPLGRIPVEWEVRPLYWLATDIVDCPHTTPTFLPGGILVARTFNLKDGRFVGERSYVSELEYKKRIARLEPQYGDVIFTREAPVGEAFIIPSGLQACLGQRTMLVRCDVKRCLSKYLLEVVYSEEMRIRFDQMVGGTTNPHLNVGDVRCLSIRQPDIKEQALIAERIGSMRHATEQSDRQLAKLRSLKTALMQDLLTGKKRVTHLLEKTP